MPLTKNPAHKLRREQRDREVRDLYKALNRKGWRSYKVYEFFEKNYHMDHELVGKIMRRVDNKPVDINKASINYCTAIKPEFTL